ncbi:triggering receptor expressed on myeloid cells isoform B [Alligator mississippiensis]|uniref:Triggering receptor expressed on myeloid cells isoform B n=1 Tax=Alligator mississippiensis TaxID=8496 RepID=A0A151P4P5_ALLMI|nr:triggering receptor expressed on myeloid cells isoform B [Alligator mississippiensis]
MEKLQAGDSGVYWCALYNPPHLYQLLEVQLAVSKGLTMENISTTPYTGPALNSSTPDSRNDGEPPNSKLPFSVSSWLILLLEFLTSKTLMAVTTALLVRRRLCREEAPKVVRSLDFMVPQSSRA